MKPTVLITALVLGLGLLFSGCASRMLIIPKDYEGSKKLIERWGSDITLAVVKEDGSLEVYNNRYPPFSPLGKFELTIDSTGAVSHKGTLPGYGYSSYGYSGYGYPGYGSAVPGVHRKPPCSPEYYRKLPNRHESYRRY